MRRRAEKPTMPVRPATFASLVVVRRNAIQCDAMRRQTTKPPSGLEPETCGLQNRCSPKLGSLLTSTYVTQADDAQHEAQHAAPKSKLLADLTVALMTIPEAERPAIVEHLKALARLSSAKRTAVLTLAADDG